MRIKNLALPVLLVLALGFFGYIGYLSMFYDEAAGAEAKLAALASQPPSIAPPAGESAPKPDYGLLRAQLAMAEYRKGVAESTRGCNCGPEVDKYTEGYRAQWCTMFASWVAKEAGSPLYNEKTKSWRLVNSRDFAANLQATGTWHSREEVIEKGLQPQLGDFVVYWRGNFEDNLGHVDVVVEIGKTPGTAGLIGGNLKEGVEYRNLSYLQHYGFLGFGRPEPKGTVLSYE